MVARFARFATLVVLVGCGDSSATHQPAAKQLAEFTYKVDKINPMIDPTAPTAGAVLELDGKRLAPGGSFTLPRAKLLGSAKLFFVVPTNCGEARVPLAAEFKLPEARQRTDLEAWLSNGGKLQSIVFDLRRTGDWPASGATVHVDNSRGKTDAKVKIGDEELVVSPGKGMTAALAIGTCKHARTVTIAGKPVGELPRGYKTTLIDVPGGSCYVYETTTYAADTAEGVPETPPRTYIRNRTGQHLVDVKAASFMSTNPGSVTVRGSSAQVRNAVDKRTSLNPIACSAIR